MSFPPAVKRVVASPLFKGTCATILILLLDACRKAVAVANRPPPNAEGGWRNKLVGPAHGLDGGSPGIFSLLGLMHPSKMAVFEAILAGALAGAFFSDKFRPYRKWIALAFAILLSGLIIMYGGPLAVVPYFVIGFVAAFLALKNWIKAIAGARQKPITFGSAEWATSQDIGRMKNEKLLGAEGLFLGMFAEGPAQYPLYYTGQRHLLTVAPTRAGKGTTAIIPNLLTYTGSALVIDPKGENAKITAYRRGAGDAGRKIAGMGQKVFVVDPWETTGLPVARFNPLDWLAVGDVDLSENAMMLADSIIVHRAESSEPFWDDEARALLMGLLLFVAIDESEAGNRTLGRVRDIIVMSDANLIAVMNLMYKSANAIVSSTAARHTSKEAKLRGGVMAALQSHTHFLDSPRMRESLSVSDFRFEDMKHKAMTVYLVLPADRLDAFGRWLRLLVQQAITMNARNIETEPVKPILFMLDEMAALGHLRMVEQAFGLMAGFGMQLWGIVQDVSQLERIYNKGWETFVGNSGVLQYLGSRDEKTASYFSKLCGMSTIEKTSWASSFSQTFGGQSASNTSGNSTNTDHIQRALAFPDELMVFRKNQVLLLIENCNPIHGTRVSWLDDPKLRPLGVNLREQKPIPAPRIALVTIAATSAAAAPA